MPNNGHATVLAFDDPVQKPSGEPDGKLFDATGHTIQPTRPQSLMSKIDEKGKEPITLQRSTLWFIATGLVLLTVLFSYGGSAIGWVRADESQKVRLATVEAGVINLQKSVDELKGLIQKEREARQAQEVQNAKALGYQLKAAEGQDHGAKK